MPYIPPDRREVLDAYANAIAKHLKETAKEGSWIGDLNYVITRMILRTLRVMFKEIRYWQIVIVLGTLQALTVEFYRRIASPYENRQMERFGDVNEFIEYDMDLLPQDLKEEVVSSVDSTDKSGA